MGKPFSEVIRNSELYVGVQEALESQEFIEKDIVIDGEKQTFLQVHLSCIKDQSSQVQGLLMVLNDVTRLKQLETMRKEFVANVSHELRTPITLIQGAVDTLLDGAKDNPKDCEHFLTIMQNHSLRLNNIIEDLLELSSIEITEESKGLEKTVNDINKLITKSIDNCLSKRLNTNS